MTLEMDISLRRGAMPIGACLSVPAGQTLALVGPNGSGKSSIALALAGLVPIDSGRVVLGGRVLDDGRTRLAPQSRRIGFVFQDRLLFPALSARANIAFGLRSTGTGKHAANEIADAWLERFDMTEHARKRPDQLSGGQAQRVALARALAVEPDLLILDEPLAALDTHARPAIRRLIGSALARFGGVKLLITHEPIEALTLADRLAVIENGRVVQTGTGEQVRLHPRSAFAAALVGTNLVRGVLRADCGHGRARIAGAVGVGLDGGANAASPGVEIRIGEQQGEYTPGDGDAVLATIHPRAITLSNERPAGSARNTMRCTVRAIDHADGCVRVAFEVDAGEKKIGTGTVLTAEITDESLVQLGLGEGASVWASFKATEVRVYVYER